MIKIENFVGPTDEQFEAASRRDGVILEFLPVVMDITAPLFFWKQLDAYKVDTVSDSCSTMHTLAKNPFTPDDFSFENLGQVVDDDAEQVIGHLNWLRAKWQETGEKRYWRAIVEFLPSGFMQRRTWSGNYAVLERICAQRRGHKLGEWSDFIDFVKENAPRSDDLIF